MTKKRKSAVKYWIGKIHLWMGLISGLFVFFLGITGCILAFEKEIGDLTQRYRFVKIENKPRLLPSQLKNIADLKLPGKHGHSVSYEPGKAAKVLYYNADPEYYYIVYMDPYSGQVLKVKDMNRDFFRIITIGHYYLWLPPAIGQPVLATATLLFVLLLISGLVLWWPKNKASTNKRFTIKWNARWRRVNYDLHNVLGFYITWIVIFIGLTGLVMGFQWFSKSVYWVSSGGKKLNLFEESFSDTTRIMPVSTGAPIDRLWLKALNENPDHKGSIEVHIPDSPKAALELALNPDTETYWKTDYRYYDQYTLKEIDVKHVFGRYSKASVADKIIRMNYDIHIGAIGGLPTKILAFIGSLIAASLPLTGFIIWWGRRNKTKGKKTKQRKSGRSGNLAEQAETVGARVHNTERKPGSDAPVSGTTSIKRQE